MSRPLEPTPLQRALALAPEQAAPAAPFPKQEFFCFRTGDLHLGVPSINVREVVRLGPLTALPRVPSFVLGVCAVRGEVVPVLDLLRFLGKGESRVTPRSRLFVGMSGKYVAAVLTDGNLELRTLRMVDVLAPPLGSESSSEHLIGVVPSAKGDALALLDFPKLLTAARQRAAGQ